MLRHDYAFPFRIDPASGQGAQTPYQAHVDQMIRQVLLTNRGERIDLPEFGCGLRQLLFAPHNSALDATTNLIVQQRGDLRAGSWADMTNTPILNTSNLHNEVSLPVGRANAFYRLKAK